MRGGGMGFSARCYDPACGTNGPTAPHGGRSRSTGDPAICAHVSGFRLQGWSRLFSYVPWHVLRHVQHPLACHYGTRQGRATAERRPKPLFGRIRRRDPRILTEPIRVISRTRMPLMFPNVNRWRYFDSKPFGIDHARHSADREGPNAPLIHVRRCRVGILARRGCWQRGAERIGAAGRSASVRGGGWRMLRCTGMHPVVRPGNRAVRWPGSRLRCRT